MATGRSAESPAFWRQLISRCAKAARPQAASKSTAIDTRPRRCTRFLRVARPLILTIMAAVAFAALLRTHHSKFEEGLVRTFHRQQSDATRSQAAFIEEHVDSIVKDLASLAGRGDLCRLDDAASSALLSSLMDEDNMLNRLSVRNADGVEIWSQVRRRDGSICEQPDPNHSQNRSASPLVLRLPITSEGTAVGSLEGEVDMSRVALRCLSRPSNVYKSLACLVSNAGAIIYDSGMAYKPRTISHIMRTADGGRQNIADAPLLDYVLQRCIGSGESGLAEVCRQEDATDELVVFVPVNVPGQRYALVMGSPRADISVPISSHERVTYSLIAALALLYFATGYVAYRSERAQLQFEQLRRQAAEAASKAKGDFLARMSHEIRTPMNGVMGMTELAMMTDDPRERQKYLGIVKDCANSLLSVINDVLDLSKIEAGKVTLLEAPINLKQCLRDALAPLEAMAHNKGLELDWNISPDVPAVVLADAGRLRQVLTNLVGNSIKFTRAGQVRIDVTCEESLPQHVLLHFSVRDTGCGISAADQQRLFAPYSQCNQRDSYRKDGTGLGLSIAKQLIEMMQGRIWIDSRPGEGTTVHFTVCLARTSQAQEASECLNDSPTTAGAAAGKALSILLVDDNPVNQQAGSLLLQKWGHTVRCLGSGEEAIAAVQADIFDLVLMDLEMPGMNGLEAAAEIRRLEREGPRHIPIVAMTAHCLQSDRQRCLNGGMDDFLTKPFRPDSLRQLVARFAPASTGDERSPAEAHPHPAEPSPAPRKLKPADIWDVATIRRYSDGDAASVRLIIDTFLKDLRRTLPQAAQAAKFGDRLMLGSLAHRWKSSLAILGAKAAVSAAIELEQACHCCEPQQVGQCFDRLLSELDALQEALASAMEEEATCASF